MAFTKKLEFGNYTLNFGEDKVELNGNEAIKPFIQNGMYDIGKFAVGGVLTKVIERVITTLKNDTEPKPRAFKDRIEPVFLLKATTVIDFRLNEKAKAKWGKNIDS